MAANTFAQEWEVYERADSSVVFTGSYTTTPAGWTLQYVVSAYPGSAALLTKASGVITKTVTGSGPYTGTFTVPFAAADTTYDAISNPTGLRPGRYHGVLSRTDSGSVKPLAAGALTVTTA
jgi:hypothetical protein